MKKSIGIFDSGVGGLTVFKAIKDAIPHENIIYFGDTARVPYGSKSRNTIIRYSLQNSEFLFRQNIKLLIVGCNTSSAFALKEIRKRFKIPVIGVIEPGVRTALSLTKNNQIGVIGTEGTIKSKAYQNELYRQMPNCQVYSKPTPLLVPLVEENWINHSVTKQVISEYIYELLQFNIDTLILGCTHYPVLKKTIKTVAGDSIRLVDSAKAVANVVKEKYASGRSDTKGEYKFYVSDNPEKFKTLGKQIIHADIKRVNEVYFAESWVRKN